jgi:hypothetical protein
MSNVRLKFSSSSKYEIASSSVGQRQASDYSTRKRNPMNIMLFAHLALWMLYSFCGRSFNCKELRVT